MFRAVYFLACLCFVSLLFQACSNQANSNSEPPVSQAATTPEPPKASPDSFAITGTLINANGSPVAKTTVSLHPLNKKGTPLFVSVFEETEDGGATPKPWNPKAETDDAGRFTLSMPRISRIADEPLKEVVIGVDAKPAGGWVTGLVSRISYVNKDKKEDMCFVKDDAGIKLARSGNEVAKVKVEENSDNIDVGKLTVP